MEKEKAEKAVLKQREYRSCVYKNKKWQTNVKERDQKRKVQSRKDARTVRKMDPKASEAYQKYERERKRKQRENLKKKKQATEENTTPDELKREVRNAQSLAAIRARRRFETEKEMEKEKESTRSQSSSRKRKALTLDEDESSIPLKISKSLFNSMTPQSKRKTKLRLKGSLLPGEKESFREVLCVNLSNEISLGKEDRSGLGEKVKLFFDREDVSLVCPDTRKYAKDPGTAEKVPLRYRLHYLTLLHAKFIAETSDNCCYETFTRHVPHYVKKPAAEDWGTCLCITCLNPELKLERLRKLNEISVLNVEEAVSSTEKYEKLKEDLQSLKPNPEKERKRNNLDQILLQQDSAAKKVVQKGKVDTITFTEWGKEKYVSKKGKTAPRSRKLHLTLPMASFIDRLLKELDLLREHLHRAHIQYKAFKEKRIRAQTTENVLTIQIDWSENPKVRQASEEKSAYYFQDQYSIHAMRAWTNKGAFSHVAMSEATNHEAPAVFASIEPVLLKYINNGATEVNIVSDSPSSQYRNRRAFWLMAELCKKSSIESNWIFLEAGHGKGTPDGIDACAKRAIKDAVSFHPAKEWNSLDDFMEVLADMVPSIEITIYDQEDIDEIFLPKMKPVTGSNKCHEVNFFLRGGQVVQRMKELSNEPEKDFSFKLEGKFIKKERVVDDDNEGEGEEAGEGEEDEEEDDEEDDEEGEGEKEKQEEEELEEKESESEVEEDQGERKGAKEKMNAGLERKVREKIKKQVIESIKTEEKVRGKKRIRRKVKEREEDEGDSDENVDFRTYVQMKLVSKESSWLESGNWYAIISPEYEYWYIGNAKLVNGDNVTIHFLQQIEEGSNKFTDEECIEKVPVTQLFYKLSQAPASLSTRRSKTLKITMSIIII